MNLRAATRRLTRRYDAALSPSGIAISQLALINFVALRPDCGVAELSDFLEMDISTATRSLRPLIKARIVSMKADVVDGRRRKLRLTAKGVRTREDAMALWEQVQKEVSKELGERGNNELLSLLRSIA
jgi:DNA-binding MarR family transcriptional regulator